MNPAPPVTSTRILGSVRAARRTALPLAAQVRHDGAVAPSARITVPIDSDRFRATTIPLAAAIARQGETEVEFVAVAGSGARASMETLLRGFCHRALREGAPAAAWSIIPPAEQAVGAYATWSGAGLLCLSTGRHQRGLGSAGRSLIGSAVPVLVCGPRATVCRDGYRRLVVGVDGARPRSGLAAVAALTARRLGLEVVFTQVVAPADGPSPGQPFAFGGDIHETAFLHRVAESAGFSGCSYDTLHAPRPAEGLLRFVGQDSATITMVGAPADVGHHHLRPAGTVARAVVRRSLGPVLLVPTAA
jgi:nucleotide-binding universal stress UspA family protein